MIPVSSSSFNSNQSSTLTNEEHQGLNLLAALSTTIIQSTPTPPVLSQKWVSPLSKKGLHKREAQAIDRLANSKAKKRFGFQQTAITSLAATLPLSISASARQLIEDLLSKIENCLSSHDFYGTTPSQSDVKNTLYSILHNSKTSVDARICELALFLYYLMRDHQVPSTTTSFFNKRLEEIREELDSLDRAFRPSLRLCASGKIDYILNVFVRHLVFVNGQWNQAGCIVVSHLIDEPCVKKLFSYEYLKRIQTTIQHLFSDPTLSKEIEKYKDQKIHPSLEWIVRCDLKLHHQVDLEFYHALCASIKMLLTDLRQAKEEENCFSVAPLVVLYTQNPKAPLLQALTCLFEGEYNSGSLKLPLTKLIENFVHENLIARQFDRKELELSTHLLTVLAGLGLDIQNLPQQDTLSFTALKTNNNNAPDLMMQRFASSLKYNYLQTLVLKLAIFSETNNLIEATTLPYFKKIKIPVLRNKKSSKTKKTEEKIKYLEGRRVFFDPLFSMIHEELTTTVSPNDLALINSYFEKWKKLLLDHLYFFPLRRKIHTEADGTKKWVIVKENGSFIYPPDNHPSLFDAKEGLALIKDEKIQYIYDFLELQEVFLFFAEEARKADFEKNKKINSFEKRLVKYLVSDLFTAHLFVNLNNFHIDTGSDYVLSNEEVKRDLPLFFSPGGSGIRVFSDYFKQKTDSLMLYKQGAGVYHFLLHLHHQISTFFKKKNLNVEIYHSLLIDSSKHVFTLTPHAFFPLLKLDRKDLSQWVDQKILERGNKRLASIISKEVAEFLLKSIFPNDDSQKMLSIYFEKNQTFKEFSSKLANTLSEEDQVSLAKCLHHYFTSLKLDLKSIEHVLQALPPEIQKHPLVSADKILNYIQNYYKKVRIEPFTLARLFREALLDLEVNSLSPYQLEEFITDQFNRPATIEIADLNHEQFGPSKETPDHVRLCIEFDYLNQNLCFTERDLYETTICDEEETEEYLTDFQLFDIIN